MSEWIKPVRKSLKCSAPAIYTGSIQYVTFKISELRAVCSIPDIQSEFHWYPKTSDRADNYANWDIQVWNYGSLHAGTDFLHNKAKKACLPYASNLSPDSEGYTPLPSFRIPLGYDEHGTENYWWFFTFKFIDGKYHVLSAPTSYNDTDTHSYYGLYDSGHANAMDYSTGAWYNNFREWSPTDSAYFSPCFVLVVDDEHDNDLYFGWWFDDSRTVYCRFGLYRLADFPSHSSYIPTEEIDIRFGAESTEEGYPTDEPEGMFDFDSDQIDLDELPTESVSNSGYLNVYKVTPSALAGIMEEVNPKPTIIEPPSDIVDYPRYIGDQLGQLIDVYFSKGLSNYIIDCHMIPCAVTGGTSTHIQVGAKTIINTAPKLTSDYVEVNLGSVNIPQCHYNFLDLATDIKLFLPFVSYVPLPPELVLGGTLSVSYRFNVLDGSFVATVKATSKFSNLSNSVIAQYSGCCCVHMPLASNDYANIVSGIVGTVGSVSRLDGRGAVIGALDTAQQLTTGGDFTLSNGYNASSSFLGHRTPYLIISRPVKSFSGAYPHEKGLPCNVRHKLSDVHGYTECGNIHLDGFGCTAREKEMLAELLQNGVILP